MMIELLYKQDNMLSFPTFRYYNNKKIYVTFNVKEDTLKQESL